MRSFGLVLSCPCRGHPTAQWYSSTLIFFYFFNFSIMFYSYSPFPLSSIYPLRPLTRFLLPYAKESPFPVLSLLPSFPRSFPTSPTVTVLFSFSRFRRPPCSISLCIVSCCRLLFPFILDPPALPGFSLPASHPSSRSPSRCSLLVIYLASSVAL